ncbi:MAG: hypothetical protein ACRDNW_02470 [Trebonia sp.]
MSPIITQPGVPAHVHPDDAARSRRNRLARASAGQAEAALTYLSVIDPLMFEIAMDAADLAAGGAPGAEALEDEEPVPVCRRCGGLVGIFLDHGLEWQHFRGDGTTAGTQEIYDPGHPAGVTWRLPGEDPEQP